MGGAGEGGVLGAGGVNRIDEVTFLRKLQRLLEEGDFVATYKFALLQALADLSVENESAGDGTHDGDRSSAGSQGVASQPR